MTNAEKILQLKTDYDRVYSAGVKVGSVTGGYDQGYAEGYEKCTEDMQDDLQNKYDEGYGNGVDSMQSIVEAKYIEGYAAGESAGYNKCTEDMQDDLQEKYSKGYSDGVAITNDGTATSDDILAGESAYVKGAKVKGNIPKQAGKTITPKTSDQTAIPAKTYAEDKVVVLGDADLIADNIKVGINIFGVAGKFTNDATATADKIRNGFTAYVKGEKIKGTAKTYEEGYAQCNSDMQDDLQEKYNEGYAQCNSDMQDDLQKKYNDGYSAGETAGETKGYADGYNKCTEDMQDDLQAKYTEGYDKCTEDMQDDLQAKYDEGHIEGEGVGYEKGYDQCYEDMQPRLQEKYNEGYNKCTDDMQDDLQEKYTLGYSDGFEEGEELVDRTLYGAYVLKKTPDISALQNYNFIEDFTGKGVYAHFVDSHKPTYIYSTVDKIVAGSELYLVNVKNNLRTYLSTYDGVEWYYEFGDWYEEDNAFSAYDGGTLPDLQSRIIVFTEPLVVSQQLYDVFELITDNGTSEFITSDATAKASDITNGKTAYGYGGKITGTAKTTEEIEADGAENEKKRFWDILQDYGNRSTWTYAFYQWRVDIIDPQYDITPINATNMFQGIIGYGDKKLNVPELEARNGIKFDFSKCTTMPNMIAWSAVEDLGFIDTTSATNCGSTFSNSSTLKRLSIAIKEDGSQNFSGGFDYTRELEDFTVVSGVFGSNLNFQWAHYLSKASITNIINHLSDTTSGLSVTFSYNAVFNAFVDKSTGTLGSEWRDLIATKTNWTINLNNVA